MKPIDIVILVLAVLAVVGVAVWRGIRIKQGKFSCDGCKGCTLSQKQETACQGKCESCSSCPISANGTKENEQKENMQE